MPVNTPEEAKAFVKRWMDDRGSSGPTLATKAKMSIFHMKASLIAGSTLPYSNQGIWQGL
jgi:hypothetical protein